MTLEQRQRLSDKLPPFLRRRAPWLRRLAQLAIIIACLSYLLFQAREIGQYRELLQIKPFYLLTAWVFTVIALWLGASGWFLVLRSLGVNLSWKRAAWIHLSTNLAKYIPGYGWQLVGKAYLTRQMGVSTRLVSLAMIYELAILLLPGAALAGILAIHPEIIPLEQLRLFVLICGFASLVAIILIPALLPRLGRAFWRIELSLRRKDYWLGVGAMTVGWLSFGFSFWALGASIIPLAPDLLPLFLFTIVGSFIISLAVIIVPGGIGVRESVMVFLLAGAIGNSPAVLIAAISRLISLISELSAAWMARLAVKEERLLPQTGLKAETNTDNTTN